MSFLLDCITAGFGLGIGLILSGIFVVSILTTTFLIFSVIIKKFS